MTIYNKNNFLIGTLASKERFGQASGVHVTEKLTEVTNGHYLVRISVPKDCDATVDLPQNRAHKPRKQKRVNVIVSPETSAAVVKSIPGAMGFPPNGCGSFVWLGRNTDEKSTEFLTGDHTGSTKAVMAENVEGKFPDSQSVIKNYGLKRKGRMVLGFNAEYMKKLCDFLCKAKVRGVKMSLYGPDKPIKLENADKPTAGENDIVIIFMPMKLMDKKEESKKEEAADQKPEQRPDEGAKSGI